MQNKFKKLNDARRTAGALHFCGDARHIPGDGSKAADRICKVVSIRCEVEGVDVHWQPAWLTAARTIGGNWGASARKGLEGWRARSVGWYIVQGV